MYLKAAFWVNDKVVPWNLNSHQLSTHHCSYRSHNKVIQNINVVLKTVGVEWRIACTKTEVFWIFSNRLFEERLIGPSKGFKINHFDFFPFDGPQTGVHLKVWDLIGIMLKEISLTNDNIGYFDNSLTNLFYRSRIFCVLEDLYNI